MKIDVSKIDIEKIKKEIADMTKKHNDTDDKIESAFNLIKTEVVDKYFPPRQDITYPKLFAKILALYDYEDQDAIEINQNTMRWLFQEYVIIKIPLIFDKIDFIHDELVRKNYIEERPFDDNHKITAYYIPNLSYRKEKGFILPVNGVNWIFIANVPLGKRSYEMFSLNSWNTLKVYRYWNNHYIFEDSDDEWVKEEAQEYKDKGIIKAITSASYLAWEYSDNVDGYEYVSRPNLQWYKDRDFNVKSNNRRYTIINYSFAGSIELSWEQSDIWRVLFDLACLEDRLNTTHD